MNTAICDIFSFSYLEKQKGYYNIKNDFSFFNKFLVLVIEKSSFGGKDIGGAEFWFSWLAELGPAQPQLVMNVSSEFQL